MLFEDPNRTNTEDYYNPQIANVIVTIEGVPNQLYSKGMLAYQQWVKSINILHWHQNETKKQTKWQKT